MLQSQEDSKLINLISRIYRDVADAYKQGRKYDVRDYLEVNDIEGAKPT